MTDLKEHAIKAYMDGFNERKAMQQNEWKELDIQYKKIVWKDIGHELESLMTFDEFCAQATVKVDPLYGNSKNKLKSFDISFPDSAQIRLLVEQFFGRPRVIPIREGNKYQTQTYIRDFKKFVFDLAYPTFMEALGRSYMQMEKSRVKK